MGFEIVREGGTSVGLRALVFGDYLVLYEVTEEQVNLTNLIDCRTKEFQNLASGHRK